MFRPITILTLSALLAGSAAFAQDETTATTTTTEAAVTQGVYQSNFTVSGRFGALNFEDTAANYTSRLASGISLNWSFTNMASVPAELGLEAGLLFSHLGAPGTNFVASNGGTGGVQGVNALVFPLTLVLGYHPSDSSLFALNLGTNGIYQNNGSTMNLGRPGASGSGSSVEFFPSIGFTSGWAISKVVALSLRGDYIPTPISNMFTIYGGATIPIG